MSTNSEMEHSHPPPRKRPRVGQTDSKKTSTEPRLFAPFRALGLITNHLPFVLQTRSYKGSTEGPRLHLVTCLGKAWAMWEGGKMGLLFVGPDAPEPITYMAMEGNSVWTASGPNVIRYIRGKETGRLVNPLGTTISFILVFGSQLLALTDDGSRMLAWDVESEELQATIQFDTNFIATSILHPATYLNKVLVSSSQGDIQLWNIRTQTRIHTFPVASLLTLPTNSQSSLTNPISALVQSPAIDVVGIGFASGEISVYDVRTDERLMRMKMQDGAVRALSFRSDGQAILASASSIGHIALWDLNAGGRLLHLMRGAHDGAVTSVEWVPGQPLLISSGEDNSVKQWVFDSPTSPPRLLKFRSGHHAPPHLIRYYGEDGKQILTASRDRSLRCTSVVRDSRSFEFSQGSLSKKATSQSIPVASLKLPPINAVSYSAARARDWDDILTAHADETFARTWSMKEKKIGKYAFGFGNGGKKGAPVGSVKAVCVSACGNFGLASSSTGAIHMYNMQSGILRKTYSVGPCPPEVTSKFRPTGSTKKKLEERCITGLATDALNGSVVASTLDGTVNFFDFHTAKLEHTLVLPSSAVSITLHRDSGLLAVICDDLLVRIVDIETRRVVRELGGFRGRVLDVTFSPDSRWLVTTSLDSIIRTFDIPTGRLIDAFRTASVATSVTFSPTNDFLATAHVDSVGVYLWANRAQYSEVSFQSVSDEDVQDVSLPSMQGEAEEEALDALSSLTLNGQETLPDVFLTQSNLDGDLVTFSLLPRSKWQTLLNFEVIQQRNKPKEPPKEPERAPFFLPTLPGLEPRFAIEEKESDANAPKSTKRLQKAAASSTSVFYKKLAAEKPEGDYEEFFAYAKTLSPAALDLELHELVTLDALRLFLKALHDRLCSHRDFEAVQTFLNVFLRMHGDVLMENEELHQELEALQEAQRKESEKLVELLAWSLGTLSFVRDTL
ncbi:Utp21-domain-containing protein [Laetiporus sulphureus 93-53]|uniref:Utp21-domain-containing protein n=1 Tax=Laetiporus sulphureus 93-53 TaxID=1314785 RepID=A0A165G063_9APHY|nr:Utp21-domain-containing protein [Laetiporus sulphureus 93-53]KZT09652.1 Utp21-domain-containing protein [Laetiporus sulphureus 93-53]